MGLSIISLAITIRIKSLIILNIIQKMDVGLGNHGYLSLINFIACFDLDPNVISVMSTYFKVMKIDNVLVFV